MTATFISICFVLTNCVCALIIIIGMINLLLLLVDNDKTDSVVTGSVVISDNCEFAFAVVFMSVVGR